MSDLLGVSPDLNPVLRAEILRNVGEDNLGQAFKDFRVNRLLQRACYPLLPRSLWGLVALEVEVPVRLGNGEVVHQYETVAANEVTVTEHGDSALPNLLAVDTPVLTDIELARYTDYCLRWQEFLEALAGEYEGVISVAEQQRRELLGLLPTTAFEGTPRYKAESAAKTDPYVRELERNLVFDKEMLNTLRRRIQQIRARVVQNSREQSRRSSIGPGYGPGSPSPASPSSASSRRGRGGPLPRGRQ